MQTSKTGSENKNMTRKRSTEHRIPTDIRKKQRAKNTKLSKLTSTRKAKHHPLFRTHREHKEFLRRILQQLAKLKTDLQTSRVETRKLDVSLRNQLKEKRQLASQFKTSRLDLRLHNLLTQQLENEISDLERDEDALRSQLRETTKENVNLVEKQRAIMEENAELMKTLAYVKKENDDLRKGKGIKHAGIHEMSLRSGMELIKKLQNTKVDNGQLRSGHRIEREQREILQDLQKWIWQDRKEMTEKLVSLENETIELRNENRIIREKRKSRERTSEVVALREHWSIIKEELDNFVENVGTTLEDEDSTREVSSGSDDELVYN